MLISKKIENEKWPNVPYGVLGHSYFRIRTTNVAKAIINDKASKVVISPSPFASERDVLTHVN